MQAHHWTSAMVVSSPTHVRRAGLIFGHYPLAWQMQVAPWPPGIPLWKLAWRWCSETGYTSYVRVFDFPDAGPFLPHTQSTLPQE